MIPRIVAAMLLAGLLALVSILEIRTGQKGGEHLFS